MVITAGLPGVFILSLDAYKRSSMRASRSYRLNWLINKYLFQTMKVAAEAMTNRENVIGDNLCHNVTRTRVRSACARQSIPSFLRR
jgi:hypothetical protein